MTVPAPLDTSSQEYLLACLARHICRMPTRADRHAFLDLMRKKHDTEFMTTLEKTIVEEWTAMHRPAAASEAQHGNT